MPDMINKIEEESRKRLSQIIAKMTKKDMGVEFAYMGIRRLDEVSQIFGDSEEAMALVYVPFRGNINGAAMLAYPKESSLLILDLIQQKELGATKEFDEMDRYALGEMCNVVAGNFLAIISNTLGFKLIEGIPRFLFGKVKGIFNDLISDFSTLPSEVVAIETVFFFEPITIKGFFVTLFEKSKILPILTGER